MENITKALIIAGAVLIAIILLTLLLITYDRAASISVAQEKALEAQQLEEYNAQFEAFNRAILYGTDIVSLSNKVNQNNLDNPSNRITLYLNSSDEYGEDEDSGDDVIKKIILSDGTATIQKAFSTTEVSDFDKQLFQCEKIEYNNQGKVSRIYIKSK